MDYKAQWQGGNLTDSFSGWPLYHTNIIGVLPNFVSFAFNSRISDRVWLRVSLSVRPASSLWLHVFIIKTFHSQQRPSLCRHLSRAHCSLLLLARRSTHFVVPSSSRHIKRLYIRCAIRGQWCVAVSSVIYWMNGSYHKLCLSPGAAKDQHRAEHWENVSNRVFGRSLTSRHSLYTLLPFKASCPCVQQTRY